MSKKKYNKYGMCTMSGKKYENNVHQPHSPLGVQVQKKKKNVYYYKSHVTRNSIEYVFWLTQLKSLLLS